MSINPKITVAKITSFLESIGIPVVNQELPSDTFLPGLTIKGDNIIMDPKKLKYPGDLLHEAGHIAVTEKHIRQLIGTSKINKDWPTPGDEIATILWSFAAANHLELELNVVFHPNGYKNDSDWLIKEFSNKNYIGLPLLEWMELTSSKSFPKMDKWLR